MWAKNQIYQLMAVTSLMFFTTNAWAVEYNVRKPGTTHESLGSREFYTIDSDSEGDLGEELTQLAKIPRFKSLVKEYRGGVLDESGAPVVGTTSLTKAKKLAQALKLAHVNREDGQSVRQLDRSLRKGLNGTLKCSTGDHVYSFNIANGAITLDVKDWFKSEDLFGNISRTSEIDSQQRPPNHLRFTAVDGEEAGCAVQYVPTVQRSYKKFENFAVCIHNEDMTSASITYYKDGRAESASCQPSNEHLYEASFAGGLMSPEKRAHRKGKKHSGRKHHRPQQRAHKRAVDTVS